MADFTRIDGIGRTFGSNISDAHKSLMSVPATDRIISNANNRVKRRRVGNTG
jgi:hypothetical protein